MSSPGIVVFAYNFPHKKTQDFLFRLAAERIKPTVVLAAEHVSLNIPSPGIRVKPRHFDLIPPEEISKAFGFDFIVVPHNSSEVVQILQELAIDIGIISGARILKPAVLHKMRTGIINFHPGLLPDVRGLDALQWAIYENKPLGVTAHVIDEHVDAGWVLKKVVIPEYPDDTLIDLSLRLQQAQTAILVEAVNILREKPLTELHKLDIDVPVHKKMPPHLEVELSKLLRARLQRLGE